MNSSVYRFQYTSSAIQQTEDQRQQHADQNGSTERKVKREIVALIVEIEWKAAQPEWQERGDWRNEFVLD